MIIIVVISILYPPTNPAWKRLNTEPCKWQ